MFTPKFSITPEINSRVAEIEKLKTIVDHSSILSTLEVQLRFRASVESAHSSTSIEGNPLNVGQVEKILRGQVVTAPDYAIAEVLNYQTALDWLAHQKSNAGIFTSKQILDIHKLVMKDLPPKEKIGTWRRGSVYVVDKIDNKEIVQYQGPDAELLPHLIESFIKWVSIQYQKQAYHPVLLAALIHYIFVSIHPFSDGNGRMTRILTLHFLKSTQYDFRESLSLDSYYQQNRNKYYQALSRGKTFDDRMMADLTEFIDFFTMGFLSSAQNIAQYVQADKITQSDGKLVRLTPGELRVLEYIHRFGSIRISEAPEIMQTSKRTAQRRLMDLVKNNILIVTGKGPSTTYQFESSAK